MKRTMTQKFTILYFLLIFENFMKTVEIPILHLTEMKCILINTPKNEREQKKKKD